MQIATYLSTVGGIAIALGLLSIADPQRDMGCIHRGQLDVVYCDADRDSVADPPRHRRTIGVRNGPPPEKLLTINAASILDRFPSIAGRPLTTAVGECLGRSGEFTDATPSAVWNIQKQRAGWYDVYAYATSAVGYAVNLAGTVPFATIGTAEGPIGFDFLLVVRSDDPWEKPEQLIGATIAQLPRETIAGDFAARVLLAEIGLRPTIDYRPRHFPDAAAALREVTEGRTDAAFIRSSDWPATSELRIRPIYRSSRIPSLAFTYDHRIEPADVEALKSCFFALRIDRSIGATLGGADRFVPIGYDTDWMIVRRIADAARIDFSRWSYRGAVATW